jgi:hypothetical protein
MRILLSVLGLMSAALVERIPVQFGRNITPLLLSLQTHIFEANTVDCHQSPCLKHISLKLVLYRASISVVGVRLQVWSSFEETVR